MTQKGRVASINVSEKKGVIKEPVELATINEYGLEGDAHAGAWHRQVSVLAKESIDRFSEGSGQNYKFGDFAENITTEGIDLGEVAILDRFKIGDVELEVTQIGKACHGDGCAIFQKVGRCVMPKEGIFCRVVNGGAFKAGDSIDFEARPLAIKVITMSDRASRGEYKDKSGPRIAAALDEFFEGKRWHPEVESKVFPDDAETLRNELLAAKDAGADVVFITGGTGIGPRDISPDVVTGLADQIIPGIMDHIRLKFGADNPNALLSRSVAAVMGTTLVYALPGSVKAVNEYMAELLKTVEHLIRMIHGIDSH